MQPRVPAGTRVYAIGDTHGCLTQLAALHQAILEDTAAADARAPARRRVLVYLGDYVDRGPASREILDLLIEAPLDGFACVHLLGNHDAMMRDVLDGGGDVFLWLANGGDATVRGYGVDLDSRRGQFIGKF